MTLRLPLIALVVLSISAANISHAKAPTAKKKENATVVARRIDASAQLKEFKVRVDSIMSRDDVSRVYATMRGPINHSGRIDSSSAVINPSTRFEADDIDGVDFKRWFQWDDTGIINLEIDFPAASNLARRKNWTLVINTNIGELQLNVAPSKRLK